MSRVVISGKGSLIFYINDYLIGSTGYMIDYTKGDKSKSISCQCKIKVVDYMIFGTVKNSKKYFINLKREYPGKLYKQFVMHFNDHMVVVCVKQISDWECDLLTDQQISHIILFENTNFPYDPLLRDDMTTFNDDWMKRKR